MEHPTEPTITVPARVWHALEARVDALERERAQSPAVAASSPDEVHSRRGALRLAGAAAVGAIGAAVVAGRAAADSGFASNGAPITYATPVRNVSVVTTASTNAFLFATSTGAVLTNLDSAASATVAGYTYSSAGADHGVYGWTEKSGKHGVHGVATNSGTGVYGDGKSSGFGVWGTADNGAGVVGVVTSGFGGSFTAFSGTGVTGFGGRAALRLVGNDQPPASVAGAALLGMVQIDVNGDVWLCTAAGDPGRWQRIAGPSTAGAYRALTPGRVYDSRVPGAGGPIGGNAANRTVSVKDRLDVGTATVTLADFVPASAAAVTANVTVVNTIGAGYLTINPGGVTTIGAATVNWFADGQILNNGVNLTLDANRQLTIVGGGGANASTDVVIDITGYFG